MRAGGESRGTNKYCGVGTGSWTGNFSAGSWLREVHVGGHQ